MRIEPSDQDIANIINRIENHLYDLKPDFQRDIVWNKEKQQKLIDSIMRGWHIPPIHLVEIKEKNYYEVLDGKQRLFSIFNFFNDEFPFKGNFLPDVGDLKDIDRKKYSQFPEHWKRKFLFTKIRILEVSDVESNEATELFLRLNLGVAVTASEKRNCIYGPVKNLLHDAIQEYPNLFCEETLGFSNSRMAYQDVLDKFFFLEKNASLENKPDSRALEKMYFEKSIDENVKIELYANLELLENVLKHSDFKLTKSTLISYYWFVRFNRINKDGNIQKLRSFLTTFEQWRDVQMQKFEQNEIVHPKHIEFQTLLSQGWIDPSSLKGRHKILIDFYEDFISRGRFGEDL